MSKKKKSTANKNYSKAKWHGMAMFKCSKCPWSTTNEDEMVKHVAAHLRPVEPETRIVDTGLVAPSGNPIVKEIEEPELPAEEETHG